MGIGEKRPGTSDREVNHRRIRRTLLLILPALWLGAPAAWAESRTAESVWSQDDAQQRATDQIPLQDRGGITNTNCQQIEIGMGSLPRYRCTVFFTPAATPAPAPTPGAPATLPTPSRP